MQNEKPNHVTLLHTIDAANDETLAFIKYMIPTWQSNGRRYGMNKRQIDAHVSRMISTTIAERMAGK